MRVVDLRWIAPLPEGAIRAHAEEARAILVVDECRRSGNVSEAIGAIVADTPALRDKPFARVTSADSFIPLAEAANLVLLQEAEIYAAAARAHELSARAGLGHDGALLFADLGDGVGDGARVVAGEDALARLGRAGQEIERRDVVDELVASRCESETRSGLAWCASATSATYVATGRNARASVTWICTPPQLFFACLWNVGSKPSGRATKPGRPVCASPSASALPDDPRRAGDLERARRAAPVGEVRAFEQAAAGVDERRVVRRHVGRRHDERAIPRGGVRLAIEPLHGEHLDELGVALELRAPRDDLADA